MTSRNSSHLFSTQNRAAYEDFGPSRRATAPALLALIPCRALLSVLRSARGEDPPLGEPAPLGRPGLGHPGERCISAHRAWPHAAAAAEVRRDAFHPEGLPGGEGPGPPGTSCIMEPGGSEQEFGRLYSHVFLFSTQQR